ncbi:MAG: ribosome-binding factor A, partial [Firmicutes bacterium]|nr:ribosome-binding factor A [Bacillota bacterium]
MPSYRLDRTNDDIQRVLSELLRSVKDPRVQQGLISVTHVETTGDLKYAKVYLSVLGLENAREFKRGLKSASGW